MTLDDALLDLAATGDELPQAAIQWVLWSGRRRGRRAAPHGRYSRAWLQILADAGAGDHPRSPTSTTCLRPKRCFSLLICGDSVLGSPTSLRRAAHRFGDAAGIETAEAAIRRLDRQAWNLGSGGDREVGMPEDRGAGGVQHGGARDLPGQAVRRFGRWCFRALL
jgi:hypothetical protein